MCISTYMKITYKESWKDLYYDKSLSMSFKNSSTKNFYFKPIFTNILKFLCVYVYHTIEYSSILLYCAFKTKEGCQRCAAVTRAAM